MKRIIGLLLTTIILSISLTNVPIANQYGYAQAEAATVALNKTMVTLFAGESFILSVNGTTQKVNWKSSDKAIVTVTSKGKITGNKKGTAIITASVGSKKLKCSVTVKTPAISSDTLELELASSSRLSILGTSDPIKWISSDSTIAVVNEKGLVMARAIGTAQITGEYKGKSYRCKVTVKAKKLQASITDLTCYEDTVIAISVKDYQKGEALSYKVANPKIVRCSFGEGSGDTYPLNIKLKGYGTTTITITSNYSKEELVIKVTAIDKLKNTKVKLAPEEIYEKCTAATVQVNTNIGLGSGFFINNGIIVTNYHVIKDASSINVQLQNGKQYQVDYIVGYNRDLDIAILSIPSENNILVINQHGIKAGEDLYTLGSSLGFADTFTNGIISNISRVIDKVNYIQINAAITNGNSGGPLINSYGEVIGINSAMLENGQNLNFAININQLYQVSTGNPVTVTEFSKREIAYFKTKEMKNIVKEDPSLTNSLESAQQLPLDTIIYGEVGISKADKVDMYKLILPSSQCISILIAPQSEDIDVTSSLKVDLWEETSRNTYSLVRNIKTEYIDGVLFINHIFSAGSYRLCVNNKLDTSNVAYYLKIR
jgi:hypothetical protein